MQINKKGNKKNNKTPKTKVVSLKDLLKIHNS